jgi:eukaryotic-like serine/threonine-protein kinase
VGKECRITLAGEPAELGDLRDGDAVEIAHDSPGVRTPEALAITATRAADPSRWALLVANKDYDDRTLSPLEYPVADAKLLRDALVKRYRVPAEQAELFADETRLRVEQGISDRLGKPSADGKLIFYFAGHAFKDDNGQVFLALKDYDFRKPESGIPLQWLVDELEKCPAKEKLLLLDCCQAGAGAGLAKEPSTAEMIQSLKARTARTKLRTVTAVVSCKAGQRGQVLPDKGHGLFAWSLAEGFSGKADKNRDNRLEPTELFSYLSETMPSAGSRIGAPQTPELFPANDRPPRLSEEAKKAVQSLAAYQNQDRVKLQEIEDKYNKAQSLAGKEPDAKTVYGLLLLKQRQRDAGIKILSESVADNPNPLSALQAMAWSQFVDRRNCDACVRDLKRLIGAIAVPKKEDAAFSEDVQHIFIWTGQLREFCATAALADRTVAKDDSLKDLDQAVAERGADTKQLYQQGRDLTKSKMAEFDKKIEDAKENADTAKMDQFRIDRRLPARYAAFPWDEAFKRVVDGLDD